MGEAYAVYRVDADGPSNTITTSDSVTVGLKGTFGDVSLGEAAIPIEEVAELANDIVDIEIGDYDQSLGYNNTFGPVSVFAAFAPEGSGDLFGFGAQYSAGGLTIGAGIESLNENIPAGQAEETVTAVAGKFANNMFSVAAHHAMYDEADSSLSSVQGKYFSGDWTFALTYTTVEDTADYVRPEATYALGEMTYVNFRLTSMSPEVGEDTLTYRVLLGVEF